MRPGLNSAEIQLFPLCILYYYKYSCTPVLVFHLCFVAMYVHYRRRTMKLLTKHLASSYL